MWPFKKRTYESEYERGRKEANIYLASHSYEESKQQTNHARCDRDFCEGIMRGFPKGWIDAMTDHGIKP